MTLTNCLNEDIGIGVEFGAKANKSPVFFVNEE